jgi:hypothetical protein
MTAETSCFSTIARISSKAAFSLGSRGVSSILLRAVNDCGFSRCQGSADGDERNRASDPGAEHHAEIDGELAGIEVLKFIHHTGNSFVSGVRIYLSK